MPDPPARRLEFGDKEGMVAEIKDYVPDLPSAAGGSAMSEKKWRESFKHEIGFWDNWVKAKGGIRGRLRDAAST
jgi:hypothetical protein